MKLSDEIAKLSALHQAGAFNEAEFQAAKAQLLRDFQVEPLPLASQSPAMGEGARSWGMWLHLSQFAGYLIPLAGFIVPILIWLLKKESVPGLDAHGKQVINWMISHVIYVCGAGLLCLVLVGIPLLMLLGLLGLIFPIIGAIKASEGTVWKYPLSIRFLR